MTKLLDQQHNRDIEKNNIVILYHADCSDGFGAAWAAYKKFGDNAAYISVYHQMPLPDGLTNKEIYMVDFTYPEAITRQLIKHNKRVTSIDHHKTVEDITKITKDYRYELNNSGSVLAWKYFHPNESVPYLLLVVEDSDIHKFEIPDSKELFAYIDSYQFEFDAWNELSEKFENKENRPRLVRHGRLLLQHERRLVAWIIQSSVHFVKFEGMKVPIVNSFLLHGDIANELANQYPPIGLVWWEQGGALDVSLRSDGSVDVGEIAKEYGGGGHKAAAGFSIPFKAEFPWNAMSDE